MAGRTVVVTGASGFIGRAVAERLRAEGDDVRGIDLRPGPGVTRGDVTVPGAWQDALAGADLVVHTAAVVGFYSSPRGYWEANVRAPRLVLDAAARGGAGRVVHLSSIVTFGFDLDGVVDERTPVRPNGVPYVDTKIASEQVVLAAHARGEVPCTVVRPGDVYGPGSRPWTLEPVRLLRAGKLALPAGGRGLVSPVFVDDLVEGIVRAGSEPRAAGEVLVLTGAEPCTTGDFIGFYARMAGVPAPRTLPTPLARTGARLVDAAARVRGDRRNELTPHAVSYLARRRADYSIARARAVLGWAPRIDLPEGMRRTEAWLRAEGLL